MSFTVVVKPTHICNLDCTYCYNDDIREPIMSTATLSATVKRSLEYGHSLGDGPVDFIWHGGEPLVAGIEFYRNAVRLQEEFSAGGRLTNSVQTNGVLINDQWLDFFRQNSFSVSISIDGPKRLHDRFRVDRGGNGTFDKVLSAITKVKRAGVPLGVCVVISRSNINHVDEIYDFLAENQIPFTIIPLNRSGGARKNYQDVGLGSEEYADAWIQMYDRWFDSKDKYVYCSEFVFKTRSVAFGRPSDCVGLRSCASSNISVDPMGDIFACATLSGEERTRYGNIVNDSLFHVMSREAARRFIEREVDPQCAKCSWQHICNGGCLARAYKFFGDSNQRDYYCPSLFKIYEHISLRVRKKLDLGAHVPAIKPKDLGNEIPFIEDTSQLVQLRTGKNHGKSRLTKNR